MERDQARYNITIIACRISTHTLTWSVTGNKLSKVKIIDISTHTLTWSVTATILILWNQKCISTHTLTWSVTVGLCMIQEYSTISTHTLTWSVTLENYGEINPQAFQLTRSRGAWPQDGRLFHQHSPNFNSHAHVERDVLKTGLSQHLWHFNSHAHVERDIANTPSFVPKKDFNSHAHVERDVFLQLWPELAGHFNSHAHVERDSMFFTSFVLDLLFQLTRSRGAWRCCHMPERDNYSYFNSHAHVERDEHACAEVAKYAVISTHTLTWSVT